jgi:hypothetical protein
VMREVWNQVVRRRDVDCEEHVGERCDRSEKFVSATLHDDRRSARAEAVVRLERRGPRALLRVARSFADDRMFDKRIVVRDIRRDRALAARRGECGCALTGARYRTEARPRRYDRYEKTRPDRRLRDYIYYRPARKNPDGPGKLVKSCTGSRSVDRDEALPRAS